jgi:hypothetical protein
VSQYYVVLPILFGVLAETRALRGDARGANEAVRDWHETGQQGSELLGLMLTARARDDRVHAEAEARAGVLAFLCSPSVLAPSMYAIASEVAHATEHIKLADRIVGKIDDFPDANVVMGPGFPYLVERSRALALDARGDTDDALATFRRALDVADTVGVPVEVARSHVAIARLLAEDEPTAAARHADAARAIADRHEFVDVARAARAAVTPSS